MSTETPRSRYKRDNSTNVHPYPCILLLAVARQQREQQIQDELVRSLNNGTDNLRATTTQYNAGPALTEFSDAERVTEWLQANGFSVR